MWFSQNGVRVMGEFFSENSECFVRVMSDFLDKKKKKGVNVCVCARARV
jgi:hypothetical protein